VAVDEAEFASSYWGQAPLLSTRDHLAAGFEDLFSLEAADELLSRRGLRTPFIRIARDGRIVDSARYTGSGGVGAAVRDQVSDDRVLALFLDGHTIVLQGLHRLWPPLIDLTGALSTELGHPVQVNAYITPSSSTGFSAHYDVHDVFVLQIAGEKQWRIHEPVHPDPLRNQPWTDRSGDVAERAAQPPCIDTVLRPGDALYLPRGYLHEAEALGGVSVHLTIGVHPVTRYTLVEALTAIAADEPALRSSLAVGLDLTDPADLEDELAATIDALVSRLRRVSPGEMAARLAGRTVDGNRPAPLGPLAQAAALSELSAATVLTARDHLRHALRVDGDELVLVLADRSLRLPVSVEKAVRALLDGAPIRVRDLPGLDEADALVLAHRLVREGVAVLEPDPPGSAGHEPR
jgi:lysine-specific demethylase/histidyl-hydroxylase NO66